MDGNESGSWKPWHPRGIQATLPLPGDATLAFAAINAALDAGWLTAAPGLEAGEEKEQVGYVLVGTHEKDGEATPFLLLYAAADNMTWSFLKVWLNKPEDIAAFEYASKMQFNSLPDYVGNDKPQRGASSKTDRFIVKAPKPFGVVFRKNPKHDDTEEGKMRPARLFVRWVDQRPAQEPAAPQASQALTRRSEIERQLAQASNTAQVQLIGKTIAEAKGDFSAHDLDALREATQAALNRVRGVNGVKA